MKKLNVSLVRARNIVEIVNAISERGGISRAEIANHASVSVMTVSNIMEILLRNGAVYETEHHTENVGRNPALVYFSTTKWMMVLNLIDWQFTCSFMTLELKPFEILSQEYDKTLSYQENLERFLKVMADRSIALQLSEDECIGISVCLPSVYDMETDTATCRWIPDLASVQIKDTIRRVFDYTIIASADAKLAGIACVAQFKQFAAQNMMYLCIDSNVRGALIADGNVVMGDGGYAGDLGSMLLTEDVHLEDRLTKLYGQIIGIAASLDCPIADLWKNAEGKPLLESYTDCIARALYNASCVFSPTAIVIDGHCTYFGEEFTRRIDAYLCDKLLPETRHKPEILTLDSPVANAVTGAAIRLREKWIKELT